MAFRITGIIEGNNVEYFTNNLEDFRLQLAGLPAHRFMQTTFGIGQRLVRPGSENTTVITDDNGAQWALLPYMVDGRTALIGGVDVALLDVDRIGNQPYLFRATQANPLLGPNNLLFGNQAGGFLEGVGTVGKVRDFLRMNQEHVKGRMDPLSLISELPGEEKTIEGSIQMYSEMSCVFLGLSLMFGKGKFLEYLRMAVGVKSGFVELPSEYSMCKEITSLTLKNAPHKKERRGNELVAHLVFELNRVFPGEMITHSSMLEEKHIAHIALLLNVNIHLLQEYTYKKMSSTLKGFKNRRVSGMVGSNKNEHVGTLHQLMSNKVRMYTSYLGAKKEDHCGFKGKLKVTDIIFLVSKPLSMGMHIECEYKVSSTMAFAAHILFTGFHYTADTRRRTIVDGEDRMTKGNSLWSGPLNKMMSTEMVYGLPLYSTSEIKIRPGDKIPMPLSVQTQEELQQFFEGIKLFGVGIHTGCIDIKDQLPFGTMDICIGSGAFEPKTREKYIADKLSGEMDVDVDLDGKYFSLVDVLDEVVVRIKQGMYLSMVVPSEGVQPDIMDFVKRRTRENTRIDIDNVTILNQMKREGIAAEKIEETRLGQPGPEPTATLMSVSIRGFVISFECKRTGVSTQLRVSTFAAPDLIFAGALMKSNSPFVDRVEAMRLDCIREMEEKLIQLGKDEEANEMRIIKLEEKLKTAAENVHCVRDTIAKTNIVAEIIKSSSILPNQFGRASGNVTKGATIMKRLSTVYSADQEIGMMSNPIEWNDFIPRATTCSLYEEGQRVSKLDYKRQYTTIAQGGGNKAFRLDMFGMSPQHLIPRNPHLMELGDHAVESYFVDCGLINIDPGEVDFFLLEKYAPKMFRSCHNLYTMLAVGSIKVVDSVTLINWTEDFKLAASGREELRGVNLAYYFQFEILHLKTGRFGFDPHVRYALGHVLQFCGGDLKKEGKFLNDMCSGEFGIEVREQLKERLVVPTICQIIVRGEEDGVLRVNKDITNTKVDAMIETGKVFLLHAMAFEKINNMKGLVLADGTEITASMVKTWCNSYVGKLRETNSKGWCHEIESDLIPLEKKTGVDDSLVRIRTEEFNPNSSVFHTTLPRSKEEFVHLITTKMRSVRNHYDAFRGYIVRTGARMMEDVLYEIPLEGGVLITRTDGCTLETRYADTVEDAMYKNTFGVILPLPSLLPGEMQGYTRDNLSLEEMKKDIQSRPICEKAEVEKVNHGMLGAGIATIQKCPSTIKTVMDSMKGKTIRADEEMYTFYQKYERKQYVDELLPSDCILSIPQFALWVSQHLNPSSPGEVDCFSIAFTDQLVDTVLGFEKLILSGPPGVGKSYLAKKCASKIKKKYPDETTIVAVPFHMLRRTYEGSFDWCKTYQSLFGTGINAENAKYDPFTYYNRTNRAWTKDKPHEQNISLLVLDEFQCFSVQTEELVKIISNQARFVLLCGDDYQQPNTGHTGMCLKGSVARTISNGVVLDMNIEYRNPNLLYINARHLTRQGTVTHYLSPDICDYTGPDDSLSVINQEVLDIATGVFLKGFPSTVIACQNWDIAGMVIMQVVRVLLLMGAKEEHPLIHIGRVKAAEEMEDDDNVENEIRNVFSGKIGRKNRKNAHQQGVHGIPLLFFSGIIYNVTKTFKTHVSSRTIESTRVYQTTLLRYERSELKEVSYKINKRTTKNIVRYYIFRRVDQFTKEPKGEEIHLSCYETATYLMYPFVIQHVSMIGLTLDKVTILQVACSWVKNGVVTFNRTYHFLKNILEELETTYKDASQYVRKCRQLQVALTRVPKGGKTKVIEMFADIPFYEDINMYVLSGAGCDGFCSLYRDYTIVDSAKYKFRYAIRMRAIKCTEVRVVSDTTKYTASVEFPEDKLVVPGRVTIGKVLGGWFTAPKRTLPE